MHFEVGPIFKFIGPAASIIFAAWIFMGFLQARYDAAYNRYLAIIDEYRAGSAPDGRRESMQQQVSTYKRRCNLMNAASSVGIVSAIFLISTLIVGELAIIMPASRLLQYGTDAFALIGLSLVIVASVIVLIEGSIIHRQISREASDIGDLQDAGSFAAQTAINTSGREKQAGL